MKLLAFKKICVILIAFFIVNSAHIVFADFSDVPDDHKYYDAITELEDLGIIDSAKNYRPDKPVKRAEFYKMILRSAGYKAENDNDIDNFAMPYKDVRKNAPYARYVKKAFKLNIAPYFKNFLPTRTVSRFNAIRAILKLEGVPTPRIIDENLELRDVRSNSYFAPYVKKALDLQIIDPSGKNFFGLFSKLSRGELADILYRMYLSKTSLSDGPISDEFDEDDDEDIIFVNAYSKERELRVLRKVYEEITTKHIYSSSLTKEEKANLVYAGIKAMVDELGDSFSVFLTPEESDAMRVSLNNELEGIGAHVTAEEDKIIIVAPLRDSPAEEAGIQPRDVILNIDGESTGGMSLVEATSKIRGTAGTEVTLTIERKGSGELEITIVRGSIKIESVAFREDGDVGIIEIVQFSAMTDIEFMKIVDEIQEKSYIKGLIIDMRNNPGGYLNTSVTIAGQFLKKGKMVVQLESKKYVEEQETFKDGKLRDYPLVILANGGSASASEIVIGAIVENRDVTLVGGKTYGKGTVQELLGFSEDGSSLKLTVARWLTPEGNTIDKRGIEPDIEIADDPNTRDIDEAYERAKMELFK